jgi:hypothetical protein
MQPSNALIWVPEPQSRCQFPATFEIDNKGYPELKLLNLLQLGRHVHTHQICDARRTAAAANDSGDASSLSF